MNMTWSAYWSTGRLPHGTNVTWLGEPRSQDITILLSKREKKPMLSGWSSMTNLFNRLIQRWGVSRHVMTRLAYWIRMFWRNRRSHEIWSSESSQSERNYREKSERLSPNLWEKKISTFPSSQASRNSWKLGKTQSDQSGNQSAPIYLKASNSCKVLQFKFYLIH